RRVGRADLRGRRRDRRVGRARQRPGVADEGRSFDRRGGRRGRGGDGRGRRRRRGGEVRGFLRDGGRVHRRALLVVLPVKPVAPIDRRHEPGQLAGRRRRGLGRRGRGVLRRRRGGARRRDGHQRIGRRVLRVG